MDGGSPAREPRPGWDPSPGVVLDSDNTNSLSTSGQQPPSSAAGVAAPGLALRGHL